jgi:hypothetical protein
MYFATILDKNYITRAHVMLNSLIETTNNTLDTLFIFCLDDFVYDYFQKKDKVCVIRIKDLENQYPELILAKSNRTFVEYIFTLSPFLPLYVLNKFPNIERITTLDADLYFISNPNEVINSLKNFEIGITPHSFPPELSYLEKHGIYNVSFQSFPRTDNAISCLNNWAKSCIEFCGDEIDEFGRYADQKYLDNWNKIFHGVVDFPFPQIGLAPWNIKRIENQINTNQNIIFYHFHDFKIRSKFHATIGLVNYNYLRIQKPFLKLYQKYWNKLTELGHKTDNAFKRHSDNKSTFLFLRDLKNKPVLIRLMRTCFYFDFRSLLNPIYKFIRCLN